MADKLGLIAGRGDLPRQVIAACRASGRPLFVLAFPDQTDPETIAGTDHRWVGLGAASEALSALRDAGVRDIVMAGGIQRPGWKQLKPDAEARKILRAAAWAALGDDGVLRRVIGEIEKRGFRVLPVESVLQDLLASVGPIGGRDVPEEFDHDLALGGRAAWALGLGDAGQSVVVRDGVIVGVEDAGGTDALLHRVAGKGGILVKMRKPNQERRADLPTIGVETVRNAAAAGLSGIAVEADGALVLDREAVAATADETGLFVVGIDGPQEDPAHWPRFYVVAGEPSGDLLGGRLAQALRRQTGGRAVFYGVGGTTMTQQGLRSIFPMTELSVMGIAEVLPHIPKLLRRIRQVAGDVLRRRPSALVTIDAPDFSFRVAKRLKGQGIPLIHYVAPTVWAWKAYRAKKVAAFLDRILAVFPFEPPYFEREGLPCSFVGHSVVESGLDTGDREGCRASLKLAPDQTLICLLPGSRSGEVSRLLPVFKDTVVALAQERPLAVVLPTVPHLSESLRAETATWPLPVTVTDDPKLKADLFAAADVALAASGTVALELAMAGLPNVIAYKVSPLTAWIGRRLIKTPYANLVNILLSKLVIQERIQEACTAEILSDDLRRLLEDPDARAAQVTGMAQALEMIGKGGRSPADRAAAAVLEQIQWVPPNSSAA
ncbi:MAG: lipid-A-disaccharide synthase [Magnetospiraceae bacterium]